MHPHHQEGKTSSGVDDRGGRVTRPFVVSNKNARLNKASGAGFNDWATGARRLLKAA